MSFIEVKHINKTFKVPEKAKGKFGALKTFFSRKYNYIKAIKDISFSIKKGEIVGYIGPTGEGKSTTIKILSGPFTIISVISSSSKKESRSPNPLIELNILLIIVAFCLVVAFFPFNVSDTIRSISDFNSSSLNLLNGNSSIIIFFKFSAYINTTSSFNVLYLYNQSSNTELLFIILTKF